MARRRLRNHGGVVIHENQRCRQHAWSFPLADFGLSDGVEAVPPHQNRGFSVPAGSGPTPTAPLQNRGFLVPGGSGSTPTASEKGPKEKTMRQHVGCPVVLVRELSGRLTDGTSPRRARNGRPHFPDGTHNGGIHDRRFCRYATGISGDRKRFRRVAYLVRNEDRPHCCERFPVTSKHTIGNLNVTGLACPEGISCLRGRGGQSGETRRCGAF